MRTSRRKPVLLAFSWAFVVVSSARGANNPNRIPNPFFNGTGGTKQGTTGQVPDGWRAFAVGGSSVSTTIVPVAAHELYPGSAATHAVRLSVSSFRTDQGFDHDGMRFAVAPGESYHLEFYVKTANADHSSQAFNYGFPLFLGMQYLGREPGGGGATATSTWKKITGPTFSDAQADSAHVAFRLVNDPGEDAILIAFPAVGDPPDRFPPPAAADLAQKQTWLSCNRLVATTYFYWYRWPDEHFFDDAQHTDDALTDHFVDPTAVSMLSKIWHKQQAADMIEAGIDMLWPVYWAAPGNFDSSHYSLYVLGLLPLQDALDELKAEGKAAPKVGMFYDTSSLLNDVRGVPPAGGKADLTTPEGQDVFYGTIRSFFSTIHPRHWACIDDRPIVVLYADAFAADYDVSSFDYVYAHFAADFGGIMPYIIRERSWSVQTASSYAWGAALNGPQINGIAAVGPGYDDIAVPGRTRHYRPRDGGQFYRLSWETALASACKIVHVETWSELHEGTEICETVEYGRQYITLTREYADRFKSVVVPLRVSSLAPAPGARLLTAPAAVTVRFNGPMKPETVTPETVFLTHAGPDAFFETADDARIAPALFAPGDWQVELGFSGAALPEGRYSVTVKGVGQPRLTRECDDPLYGLFTGTFPSGSNQQPADFYAVFTLAHPTAQPDFDMDDDVDQTDFGYFQTCLTGPGVHSYAINCQSAKLDADNDVDEADLRIFLQCWTGANRPYDLNCAEP